jgi:patatin-like phospholipase/acyl hydrolase
VIVTAYDLESRAPFFFKSARARSDSTRDHLMRQAARATSAAPTYFEPLELDGFSLIDGGVFAVNPAMCGLAEVLRDGAELGDTVVVSLGTGRLTRPIRHEDARGWGLVEWARPLLDVVFDGASDVVDYQLDQLLGDRHLRFQIELTRASDNLDDASPENLAALRAEGADLVARESAKLDRATELLAG